MFSLIITCAGNATRMNLGYNKMLYKYNDEYLFNKTLKPFLEFKEFRKIIITVNINDYDFFKENILNDSRIKIVIGSNTRQSSIGEGLKYIDSEYILVHDGARCFISKQEIKNILNTCKNNQVSCALGVKTKDSLRKVIDNKVVDVLNREEIYAMQTPQACPTKLLKTLHKLAIEDNICETDEVGLLYHYGYNMTIVQGEYSNIKITTKDDLGVFNE